MAPNIQKISQFIQERSIYYHACNQQAIFIVQSFGIVIFFSYEVIVSTQTENCQSRKTTLVSLDDHVNYCVAVNVKVLVIYLIEGSGSSAKVCFSLDHMFPEDSFSVFCRYCRASVIQ